METKIYQTTKEECQKDIDQIGNVCNGCGGVIEPIEMVDNASNPTFWAGCNNCQVFTHGCQPEIFKIARRLVKDYHFRYYRGDSDNERANIVRASYITSIVKMLLDDSNTE